MPQIPTLDKSQIFRIERDIAPPMRLVITLPVDPPDGEPDYGVAVFVASNPFMDVDQAKALALIQDVADRLVIGAKGGN